MMMENASVVDGGKFYCLIGEPSVKFTHRALIMAADNLLDLVCMVPSPYKDILSDTLRVAQKAHRQHASMVSQLTGLKNHKRAGTTPSWLNVKPPTYQAVKGFISTKAKQGSDKPFADALKAFAASCLNTAIERKRQEHSWLAEACHLRIDDTEIMEDGEFNHYKDTQFYTSLIACLQEKFDLVFKDTEVPSWGPPTDSSHGCPVFRGWVANSALSGKFKEVLEDLSHIFHCAMQFVDDSLSTKALKNEKKRELKEKTFTNVDEHITSQSIQSLVDKRVAAEVKKALNTTQKGKKVSHPTDCNKHFLTHIISATENPPKAMTSQGPKAAITGNRGSSKRPNKWEKRGGGPKNPGNGQQSSQGGESKNTNRKEKGKAQ